MFINSLISSELRGKLVLSMGLHNAGKVQIGNELAISKLAGAIFQELRDQGLSEDEIHYDVLQELCDTGCTEICWILRHW